MGTSLGDRYRIKRELGGDGMSRVFVATEIALGREIVLSRTVSSDVDRLVLQRFSGGADTLPLSSGRRYVALISPDGKRVVFAKPSDSSGDAAGANHGPPERRTRIDGPV